MILVGCAARRRRQFAGNMALAHRCGNKARLCFCALRSCVQSRYPSNDAVLKIDDRNSSQTLDYGGSRAHRRSAQVKLTLARIGVLPTPVVITITRASLFDGAVSRMLDKTNYETCSGDAGSGDTPKEFEDGFDGSQGKVQRACARLARNPGGLFPGPPLAIVSEFCAQHSCRERKGIATAHKDLQRQFRRMAGLAFETLICRHGEHWRKLLPGRFRQW